MATTLHKILFIGLTGLSLVSCGVFKTEQTDSRSNSGAKSAGDSSNQEGEATDSFSLGKGAKLSCEADLKQNISCKVSDKKGKVSVVPTENIGEFSLDVAKKIIPIAIDGSESADEVNGVMPVMIHPQRIKAVTLRLVNLDKNMEWTLRSESVAAK